MVSMLCVRRINQGPCILSGICYLRWRSKVLQWRICTDLFIGGFESVFNHFLKTTTKDSQDRIRSLLTRKKDLQDGVVKNNLWRFEVSNGGTRKYCCLERGSLSCL
ncbi:hypothetical protein HID58_029127 [Brassica napus]|nr:hypothetical protein HID58_029127 [Brassica napus]CAF2228250.1 unnamed protein product [Brassica napus]